jgi:aryl-alcohol dehydrogenase-like predicted oxidoreductase
MQYRQLGASGLRVSVLTMGTMTFGGTGGFASVGSTDVEEAGRQVDQCLDAGINLIDTANVYSGGLSEEILGKVLEGRRDQVLVATKARMPMGEGPNDAGLSRHHLIRECEASLRRLGTDRIDLYQVHEWDGQTPLDETLAALDDLVRAGKVRYVGCSNYAGWQLMKALASLSGEASAGSSASRSTTPCRPARPSTSWCRSPSTRAWGCWSGARWPAGC